VFGIRDPRSEIQDPEKTLIRIQDPGVKKPPDPESATLIFIQEISKYSLKY
jgi:hypothetical protein